MRAARAGSHFLKGAPMKRLEGRIRQLERRTESQPPYQYTIVWPEDDDPDPAEGEIVIHLKWPEDLFDLDTVNPGNFCTQK